MYLKKDFALKFSFAEHVFEPLRPELSGPGYDFNPVLFCANLPLILSIFTLEYYLQTH